MKKKSLLLIFICCRIICMEETAITIINKENDDIQLDVLTMPNQKIIPPIGNNRGYSIYKPPQSIESVIIPHGGKKQLIKYSKQKNHIIQIKKLNPLKNEYCYVKDLPLEETSIFTIDNNGFKPLEYIPSLQQLCINHIKKNKKIFRGDIHLLPQELQDKIKKKSHCSIQ